jgi:hypothetical protein
MEWGNLDEHDTAWEQAKELLGVGDVRQLTVQEFRDAIALAEQIRKGTK